MIVSEHAEERAGQRVGLRSESAKRLAQRAWEKGLQSKNVGGAFKRWLQNQERLHQRPLRVYGEVVYVFTAGGEMLVTVMHLPNVFKRSVQKKLQQRKKAECTTETTPTESGK